MTCWEEAVTGDCLVHMKYLCTMCCLENWSILCSWATPSTKDVRVTPCVSKEELGRTFYLVPLPPGLGSSFSQDETWLEITAPWYLLQSLSLPCGRNQDIKIFLIILTYQGEDKEDSVLRVNKVHFSLQPDFMHIYYQNRFAYSKNSLADVYTFRQGTTPKIWKSKYPII